MKRYIVTGTPGSGKTSLIRALEVKGYFVIEEAATDIIALEQAQGLQEPWMHPSFINNIVKLQKQRQMQVSTLSSECQFFDRSPVCTLALCEYLKYKPSPILLDELARIENEKIYQKQIFFIENLGFITPTEARRISFEETLIFEEIHERAYRSMGYECIKIPIKTISERVDLILSII